MSPDDSHQKVKKIKSAKNTLYGVHRHLYNATKQEKNDIFDTTKSKKKRKVKELIKGRCTDCKR